MVKNYFTEEQLGELEKNPYIQKVSEKSITYGKAFKEKFLEEYQQGKSPREILAEMGVDYRVLGKRRVDGLITRMKQYAARPEGCRDNRENSSGRPSTKEYTPTEKINRLEQKIAYLEQENEFLKKNIQMDYQANRVGQRNQRTNISSSKK
jgi:transposase